MPFSLQESSQQIDLSIITSQKEVMEFLTKISSTLTLESILNVIRGACNNSQHILYGDDYSTQHKATNFQIEMSGNLAKILKDNGWHQTKIIGGSQAMISPNYKSCIYTITGDKDTGRPYQTHPQPTSPRGRILQDAINKNHLDGFEFIDMWFLLFYRNDNEISAELSRAINCDNKQFISYNTRLILPSINPNNIDTIDDIRDDLSPVEQEELKIIRKSS